MWTFSPTLILQALQDDPVITQLANGNVLITWTDYDNSGVGSPAGADVVGRIFDPLGNAVTGEFLLNVTVHGQ